MRQVRAALVAFALVSTACGTSEPMSQFGAYHHQNKQLRLSDGQTLTVYRVKYWTFNDGSSPALQLEYEAPFDVADTARVRAMAHEIWPAFVPYVEALHLRSAILTATNLRRTGSPLAWTATLHHFGLTAARDGNGDWVLDDGTDPLPTPEPSAPLRIYEANGKIFPLLVAPPRLEGATLPN
jgi:hypothetical protein